jgi:Flp pilus assembly protein TadG
MRGPSLVRRFAADQRGVAAVEAALVGMFLVAATMNVVEVSRYAYETTQVNGAAQAAAQSAIIACDTSKVPATISCPELANAVTAALHGSSLADHVSLNSAVSERWYCLTNDSTLRDMSAANSKPVNCNDAGLTGGKPALYLKLTATYTYTPIFPGLTIVRTFDTTIRRTAWMRMI